MKNTKARQHQFKAGQFSLSQGFTLIELMIVVAIIGIIAAVAYPAYTDSIISSRRGAAQADLMALAAAMERHKAANFTYAGAAASGADTGAPAIFHQHSPSSEPLAKRSYDLKIQSVSANGIAYVIVAEAVGGAVSASDGDLLYYSDGRKAWDKDDNGSIATSEFCWGC